MGWSIGCALCNGPLSDGNLELGSTDPKYLSFLDRTIAKEVLARRKGVGLSDLPEDEDADEDTDEDSDEDEELFEESSRHSYDPRLVSEGSLEWLNSVHCLGLHEVTGEPFISRNNASSGPYGDVSFSYENDEEEQMGTAYWTSEEGESIMFPFHSKCFEVLADQLHGPGDALDKVDKLSLYQAMCLLSETYSRQLNVDYGDCTHEQFFHAISGEEFVVTEPGFSEPCLTALKDKLASGDLSYEPPILKVNSSQTADPFRALSTELIIQIVNNLPPQDLLALSTASWLVSNLTSTLWELMLLKQLPTKMGRQIKALVEDQADPQGLCYRKLYTWFIPTTEHRFGMKAPWLGVGNWRRIWRACEDISPIYWERVESNKTAEKEEEEEEEEA